MPENTVPRLDAVSKLVQVLAVVAGVVVSVVSVSQSLKSDAQARLEDAKSRQLEMQKFEHQKSAAEEARRIEAATPFLQLRLERYREAIAAAGVLATPSLHDRTEIEAAEKRFWELYWAELSMVESGEVETAMVALGRAMDAERVSSPTATQNAVYELAHALRDSLEKNWNVPSVSASR